ncbi:HNH endonuclease signature motif containing protein [Frankia sp. AgB32]|uniref:HNH endonuclease signature motif containing protein n=1 Tax=Frankia sp. AgB32 TaxID=631119 RepID=UPI0020106404|nr:HNH endonuclease signature motif containing protein [Frankia sp. AgB32]MCK9893851.1 HNH endonuclease [Frankia sp. AgB32]
MIDGRRVADLDAADCLRLDAEIGKKIARCEAERLLVRAQFAQHRPPQLDGSEQAYQAYDEFAGDELAAELGMSPAVAGRRLAFAVGVVRRMPVAVTALGLGIIDLDRLSALERSTANLADEQADEVAGSVLKEGGRPSHNAFAAAVRRRVIRIDPEGADRRRRKAAAKRRVDMRTEVDGMGRLSALLPADRMVMAFRRIDVLARQTGGTDDERDLDQRRADVLFDLLMGSNRESVRLEIQVIVPVDCLLGISESPGEIPGYGPIPAGIAREMAEDGRSTWRRILTDPADGKILEVGERRFPSPALRRYVQARNPRCIFPGCDRPSMACDLDHTSPHRNGGKTRGDNLGPQCRRHHRLKHSADRSSRGDSSGGARPRRYWKLRQPRPGHFVWTSPEGRQYEVVPESCLVG